MSKENIVEEPRSGWGGPWTEQKLNAFTKYVSAYLTVMNKFDYWETIYFDGFAGSGNRHPNCVSPLYRELGLSDTDDRLYKGAAERVLSLAPEKSFNYYYFIDKKKESIDKLKTKLSGFQENVKILFQYKSGDCNQYILELSKAMKENAKNMQL